MSWKNVCKLCDQLKSLKSGVWKSEERRTLHQHRLLSHISTKDGTKGLIITKMMSTYLISDKTCQGSIQNKWGRHPAATADQQSSYTNVNLLQEHDRKTKWQSAPPNEVFCNKTIAWLKWYIGIFLLSQQHKDSHRTTISMFPPSIPCRISNATESTSLTVSHFFAYDIDCKMVKIGALGQPQNFPSSP